MNLKEYMETHPGEYPIAETTRRLTVEHLDPRLGELEVEAHLLGEDPTGRRRIHLYATEQPVHLATYVERPEDQSRPTNGSASSGDAAIVQRTRSR